VARPVDLPDFRRPPIDEVVFGLQFEPLEGFSEVHTGLFWQRVRADYPTTSSHPRLEAPLEDLAASPLQPPPPFMIDLGSQNQGRTWLVSADEAFLLQVQNNRLIHNWRKRGAEYPHLDPLVERFWSGYDAFASMLEEEGLEQPKPQQMELSYINWIVAPISELFRPAVTLVEATHSQGLTPEEQQIAAKFLVSDAGESVARLYVQCLPAMRLEGPDSPHAGTQMTLTFKAPLADATPREAIDELVALGRNVIVRTFTDLTTDAAHQSWERYQ
jgi:uncharacterized protein (TIGR04255 family)